MLIRRALAVVGLVAVLAPGAGWAAKMHEPTVDYSADNAMEMQSHAMKGRVYYSPGKTRQEMGGEGGVTSIMRLDKHVMWTLMGDTYMEMPIDEGEANEIRSMDIEQTVMGEEVVNGVKTTKSKVIATTKDGKKFGGFFWETPEHILVKADLLMKDGEQKHRMLMELTNLKIAKQDPALFEPPPGATKTDMGAMMGGMMGGAKGKSGKGRGVPPNLDELMKGMGGSEGGKGGGMDLNKLKEMMGR